MGRVMVGWSFWGEDVVRIEIVFMMGRRKEVFLF